MNYLLFLFILFWLSPSHAAEIGGSTGNAATATALAANGANCSAGSFPLGVDASGAVESCTVASGSGTVTVVGAGALTSTAIMTGGGTTTAQTPAATATMDASGNISTPGAISTGVGGSTAGVVEVKQGTAPSLGTTSVKLYAPTSVTSYGIVLPAASATGFMLGTDATNVNTISYVGFSGTGNVVRDTSPTLVTPALGTPASGNLANATGYPFASLSGTASDAQIPDTITASNYLPLAGGTLTGSLVTGNLGIAYAASDTNPTCVAGEYKIYADLSETKLKKCTNGSAADLDTTGGTPSFDSITGGTNSTAAMVVGTGGSLGVSGSGTIAATTVVTNANLTGHITSTGNAAVLGSFTVAQLNTAVSDADVATLAGSETLTGKTLNCESTGNVCGVPVTRFYPAAGCNNTTAGSIWDLPTATPASAICVTGTNIQKGALQYADTAGGFSAQITDALPVDWTTTGGFDVNLYWTTPATTGNGKWTIQLVCTPVAASATDDPAFPTTGNGFVTITTAAPGTTLFVQTSQALANTPPTSCATATKVLAHWRVFRAGDDAADTLANSANFIAMEVTYRRAM